MAGAWAVASAEPAQAVPAGPGVVELEQPDGTTFKARQFGDEWYHGVETRSGHTIVKRQGWWVYAAKRADGSLRGTDLRVTQDRPTMRKHLRDSERVAWADARRAQVERVTARHTGRTGTPSVVATGSDPVLVILVQFQNQANLGTTQAQWASRYFGGGKSVVDFYKKNSYNQFTFAPAAETHSTTNNGVVGWLTLSSNHPDNDGQAERPIIRDAIKAADPYVNYASYDTNGDGTVDSSELHINVVMAGLEESISGNDHGHSIWANRWFLDPANTPTVDGKKVGNSGFLTYGEKQRVQLNDGTVDTHQATVGVIVHELGHDLALPDLYDTDESSAGIGDWSVMSYGSWGRAPTDPTTYVGATPTMFDAWSRSTLGWITPQRIVGVKRTTLSAAATGLRTNTTVQLLENKGGFDWTKTSGSGSFYLVENRQQRPGSYDAALPGSGLLLLKVDEYYDSNSTNRLVQVIESDGSDLLTFENRGDAGDPWVGPDAYTSGPGGSLRAAVARISASADVMSATFTASPGSAPANDDFAQAQALAGWSPSLVQTTSAFATEQSGEPGTAWSTGGPRTACDVAESLWYRYTAPTDGDLTVDLTGSASYPIAVLHRGTTLGGLSTVACDKAGYDNPALLKDVRVAKGEVVYLQVGSVVGSGYQSWWGDIDLKVTLRPANDKRSNAHAMTGRNLTHNIYTGTATVEPSEPRNTACPAMSNTLWYSVRPTHSSLLSVSTAGSTFDTVAAVWQLVRGALVPLTCADDVSDADATTRLADVRLTAGQTYYVQVGGINGGGALSLGMRLRAGNDDFPGASLAGPHGNASSFTSNATKQTGEPVHAAAGVGRSVWWTWTAARSGPVVFDTSGSAGDTVLAAYTGGSVGALTQVAANDDVTTDIFWSRIQFDAVAGQTYRIAVDNYGSAHGNVSLRFHELTDLVADVSVRDVPGTTTFMYDVTVSRTGGASTQPVSVEITVPNSVKVGSLPSGCSLDATGLKARCDVGTIDPGGRAVVELVVEPRTEGPHTGTVQLLSPDDYPAGNNANAVATPEFLCDNDFTAFADTVRGTDANEILCGGGGNDQLSGGKGSDKIFGGAGLDTAAYSSATNRMTFNLAAQDGITFFARPSNLLQPADGFDAAASVESLVATPYADLITGRSAVGRDPGVDLIYGGYGDDQISGEGGGDTVYGGFGNDTVFGNSGADRVYGEDGADVLDGGADADYLYGGNGADQLTGGLGGDNLDGGADHDVCRELEDTRIACEA